MWLRYPHPCSHFAVLLLHALTSPQACVHSQCRISHVRYRSRMHDHISSGMYYDIYRLCRMLTSISDPVVLSPPGGVPGSGSCIHCYRSPGILFAIHRRLYPPLSCFRRLSSFSDVKRSFREDLYPSMSHKGRTTCQHDHMYHQII